MEYLYSFRFFGDDLEDNQSSVNETKQLTGIIKKRDGGKDNIEVTNNELAPKVLIKKNTKENRYSNIGKINSIYNIRDTRERTRIANCKLNEISDSAEQLKSALDDATTYDEIVAKSLKKIKHQSKVKQNDSVLNNNSMSGAIIQSNISSNKNDSIEDQDNTLNLAGNTPYNLYTSVNSDASDNVTNMLPNNSNQCIEQHGKDNTPYNTLLTNKNSDINDKCGTDAKASVLNIFPSYFDNKYSKTSTTRKHVQKRRKVRIGSTPFIKYFEKDSTDEEDFQIPQTGYNEGTIFDYVQKLVTSKEVDDDETDSGLSDSTSEDNSDNSLIGRLSYRDENALLEPGNENEVTKVKEEECDADCSNNGYLLRGGEDPMCEIRFRISEDTSARIFSNLAGKNVAKLWRCMAGRTVRSRMRFWFTIAVVLTTCITYTSVLCIQELMEEYQGMQHINMKHQHMGINYANKSAM